MRGSNWKWTGHATAATLVFLACAGLRADPLQAGQRTTLHVPRVREAVVVNAEFEGKKVWEAETGNTRNFENDAGQGMVPYTEAKMRWGDGVLYVMLYAGDLDLEGKITRRDGPVERDDAFRLEFGSGTKVRGVSVSVLGTVADELCVSSSFRRHCDPRWNSHAKVAVDRDGTLNKVGDNDEEWVVEMAIPLASLGLAKASSGMRLPFSIQRCEMGVAGKQACGSWGRHPQGELVLDP